MSQNLRKCVFFCLFFTGMFSAVFSLTTTFTGNAMTMNYRIVIGKLILDNEKEVIQEAINDVFFEVNTHYNKWNPYSEISLINALDPFIPFLLSKKLAAFLEDTDISVKITDGRFDPTIEPLQKIWKESLDSGRLPEKKRVLLAADSAGWHHLWRINHLVIKKKEGLKLDFGGNAKGYAVDLLINTLKQRGYEDLYVEWGGEIRCSGRHPEGREWKVFISHFGSDDPNEALAFVSLCDQALATSGDYHQFWEILIDGKKERYTHIFDPLKKLPLQPSGSSIASVSVLAPSCQLADALATAGMVFETIEEAKIWAESIVKKNPTVAFWIAARNQVLYHVKH